MLDLRESNVRGDLLALVIALLEVIKEALVHAAVRRVEGGRLDDEEVERLGDALAAVEEAIAQIKAEHGVEEAVRSVRAGLDQAVDEIIDKLVNPKRRLEETERTHASRA